MLVVVAIIGILAALLLPAVTKAKQRAQRIQCIGNLNQIGTAFQMFAHDHQGKYPMAVPISEGGSQEYVNAGLSLSTVFYFSFRHLQTLSSDLVATKPLICPADIDRSQAESYGMMQNSNVSYFVSAFADYNQASSVLAGDRNITNDARATASLVRGAYGLRWTRELHFFKGNVLFSDTHVEQLNNPHIDLPDNSVAATTFFLPAVVPNPVISEQPPPNQSAPPPTVVSEPVSNPDSGPSSGGSSGGSSSGGSSSSSTSSSASHQPSPIAGAAPVPMVSPQNPSTRGGASSASGMDPWNSSRPSITSTDAKEAKPVAIKSNPPPAAPAANTVDEGQPPLVWLFGAARNAVGAGGWWLLLLLILLMAAMAYGFSRRKKRVRRKY